MYKMKSQILDTEMIEKRNRTFKEASVEKKRKMIIDDAITITSRPKGFKLTTGTYVNLSTGPVTPSPERLQTMLLESTSSCEVCARGVMMVSRVRCGNGVSFQRLDRSNATETLLKGIFTLEEQSAIEKIFEKWGNGEGGRVRKSLKDPISVIISEMSKARMSPGQRALVTFKGIRNAGYDVISAIEDGYILNLVRRPSSWKTTGKQ